MKIELKNLRPNPYRRIKQYPIDRAKIESLKVSIKETSFWDNILARPHPKKKNLFQLAYGHKRFIVLKELNYNEIDIPVRNLTNAMMVRIMAEENLKEEQRPEEIIQTIETVRNFLQEDLDKYNTWEEFRSVETNGTILSIKNGQAFSKLKGGIGEDTIHNFLGKNWKIWKIKEAIAILDEDDIDKEAINSLPTMYQVGQLRTAVKKVTEKTGEKPSPKAQKKVAKKYTKGETKKTELYGDLITAQYPKAGRKTPPKIDFDNYIDEVATAITTLTRKITNIRQVIKKHPKEPLPSAAIQLFVSITTMGIELKEFAAELTKRNKKQKLLKGKTK